MTKRELHCPNLLVHKVATLLAAPRPVKPIHPPIADIIRVCLHISLTLLGRALISGWSCVVARAHAEKKAKYTGSIVLEMP